MTPWPHQITGVHDVLAAIARGERRICLTSPTGGGKTRMAADLIQYWLDNRLRTILYTNRRMMVDQLSEVLKAQGFNIGIRAAGYQEDHELPIQVSSLATENARVLNGGTWHLYTADRVLMDEAHLQRGKVAKDILDAHKAAGAAIVGMTATPIDLADYYDTLVTAGITSELRKCGALVPCYHYGPDEPDLKAIRRYQVGEDISEKDNVKAIMRPGVFGRVMKHYQKINPEGKPTILFAPGVSESLWFAEEFTKRGVPAAHIDGADVWAHGKLYRTSREARADILKESEDGGCKILCNRFVLREGIDCPWLGHGIFATVFGSLQSYLQSGGRLLRAHPSLASVTLQDHGGNWWRHGSLNADRIWDLALTSGMISGLREDRLRNKKDGEPFRCPECDMILTRPTCPCGFEVRTPKHSRSVVMVDGELRQITGDIFKRRRISKRPDGPKLWERMYYRSCSEKGSRTFRAAAALFAQENNWGWPDPTWPLMPKDELDWFRLVKDVPSDRLTPKATNDN